MIMHVDFLLPMATTPECQPPHEERFSTLATQDNFSHGTPPLPRVCTAGRGKQEIVDLAILAPKGQSHQPSSLGTMLRLEKASTEVTVSSQSSKTTPLREVLGALTYLPFGDEAAPGAAEEANPIYIYKHSKYSCYFKLQLLLARAHFKQPTCLQQSLHLIKRNVLLSIRLVTLNIQFLPSCR